MTTAIFKNGGNKCRRSQVIVYLKLESPDTYIGIPQVLLCMPYLLRYGDIEFGSHFEKWPSPRYAQFLKFPPSRILKPYVYITQINSQTSIPPKCLRAYRAGPGLHSRLDKKDLQKTPTSRGGTVVAREQNDTRNRLWQHNSTQSERS